MEYTGASIGCLPQELMLIITRLGSLQTMASFWMASRFWHEKLKPVFEHPKILIVFWYNSSRQVFMLNNGIGYDVRVRGKAKRRFGHNPAPQITVKHGWFDSVSALEDFLTKFTQIMANNTKISDANNFSPIFVKVKHKNTAPTFYTSDGFQGLVALDDGTITALRKLIEDPRIVSTVPEKEPANEKADDGISVNVHGRAKNKNGVSALLYVHPNGDVNLDMWTASSLAVHYHVRTSPDVFTQLKEIMVYSKHAKSLKVLEERPYSADIYTLFDMKCLVDGKKYVIQEYTMQQDGQQVTHTNGYKTSSIKKVIKVLEAVLFNKSIESPLSGVVPAPQTFAGHQLVRLPHFRVPRDEHFSSVVSITLVVRTTVQKQFFHLDLNSNVPLADILALFREVELSLNSDDTKSRELNFKLASNVTIESVSVHSFKAVNFITNLPKPLILKVWDLLVQSGIEL